MITIILSVLTGVAFTLVATQNAQDIPLQFFGNTYSLPLFIILGVSFLTGVLVTAVFSIFDSAIASQEIITKEANYDNAIKANNQLRKDMENLIEENKNISEKLNKTVDAYYTDVNLRTKEVIKSFFYKLTHPNFNSRKDYS